MCDADAYESLGDDVPLSITATAGALAGMAEHCVMYPIDSVKTRMQSLLCEKHHTSIRRVLYTMVKEEGAFRPMRGMGAMAAGAGPAHALYFTALEKVKGFLINKRVPEHVSSGLAACAATLLHDGIMTPAEVVKQRLQMCCSPYKGTTTAAIGILRSEGIPAFYRSYVTALSMNIPFQAAMFTTYGFCQKHLNPKHEYNPSIHFISGTLAGVVGCVVTMPLDVCKTLLNTQEAGVLRRIGQTEVVGLFGAAGVIYKFTGVTGFFQGLSARILFQAPGTAIAWSVYEFFKFWLRKQEDIEVRSDLNRYDTLENLSQPTRSVPIVAAKTIAE